VRKVSRRLLPFLFTLYVVAFLDRVNFGYAALDMNSALGISAELSGIFFIGYLLFEVPANKYTATMNSNTVTYRVASGKPVVKITGGSSSGSMTMELNAMG
jgi:hypothetical protein